MKTKQILLFFFVLTFCSISNGHCQYYWSDSKKIYLKPDSTSIVIELKNENDYEVVKKQLQQSINVHQIEKLPVNGLALFVFDNKVSRNDLDAIKRNQDLKKIMFAHKINGNLPIFFTGEILLKPKADIDIESTLSIIDHGAILKKTTKYGSYNLAIQNWDSLFNYSNRIYESGLVEYCHPNFAAEITFGNILLYLR